MKFPMIIDEKTLSMTEETWVHLKNSTNPSAYSGVKAAVTAFVAADGNFVIHRNLENDSSVMHNFHRSHELKQFFDQVDQDRVKKSL
jgi:hypothetical protein